MRRRALPARAAWLAAWSLAVLLTSGCNLFGPTLRIPGYEVLPPRTWTAFKAGVAMEEITPPPGFPTGGHGPAGAVARGYWTRLWARAFFFQDAQGQAVVLVSCELFGVPAALQAAVAERVSPAARSLGVSLPPESVLLAATHTHHGPGNFLSAAVYNQFGSVEPGFSRELFDALVTNIAAAVERAMRSAVEDDTHAVTLVRKLGRMPHGFAMNRGPASFLLNPDQREMLRALDNPTTPCTPGPWDPPGGWDLPGCPRLRALDPTITVLEVRKTGSDGKPATIGALVFAAIHPSGLLPHAPLFSSDFAGIAMRNVERAEGIVAGFFNGAEGDVVARRERRDIRDVLRLAEEFGGAIAETRQNTGVEIPTTKIRVSACDLEPKNSSVRCGGRTLDATVATDPMMGVATIGGAEGDRTMLYDLGFKEGSRTIPRYGQGVKRGALDPPLVPGLRLSRFLVPAGDYPKTLPVRWVEFAGAFSIGTFPVEMTTAQALRIRKDLGMSQERLALVGLANEYASYTTTDDEYVSQDYMGASTIWGPGEGRALGWALHEMQSAASGTATAVAKRRFRPGPRNGGSGAFGPRFLGDARRVVDEELGEILVRADGSPARDLPLIEWEESGSVSPHLGGRLRRVAVQEQQPDGTWTTIADDTAARIVTAVLDGSRAEKVKWGGTWIGPMLDAGRPTREARLCVFHRKDVSRPFDEPTSCDTLR